MRISGSLKIFIFGITMMFISCVFVTSLFAQKKDGIFVDKNGVIRWNNDKAEASFFGVNYTVPFAYGYRSHKSLNADIEKAIDGDVYHMARLGLDAFRVHVWDTEISDSSGNLINNDHLRLFDYLVMKLKERNIHIFLTPLAFWGNGYPEKDEKTGSFSSIYNKQQVLVNENAIKAQENYLRQILNHVNPYTKLTYGDDPGIIAMEINNEPHHSGPKAKVTEYVNRMVKAVRSSGWVKPVFYNISESPAYADAVAKSNIDGVSFQWYPTGLVANREIKGNFIPHVDKYRIPFADSIPEFGNKARMVYEFDAGDVLQSYMYPAMAKSFREAGMQWATQFAYDPLATAYANTEYQTHYLSLAYTPSKAISLLVASKAFHFLPRLKSFGRYPADSIFDKFRISYTASLSEMNSGSEFYYSNSTSTKPLNINALQHIAGVGSSPVVSYNGTGAFFLDKLPDGSWRLEVMPDAINVLDPFAKASLKKHVTVIKGRPQSMTINIPGLAEDFTIRMLNAADTGTSSAKQRRFVVSPGVYLLGAAKSAGSSRSLGDRVGNIGLHEFVAPPVTPGIFVQHLPFEEVTADRAFELTCRIAGVDDNASVVLELRNSAGKWKSVNFERHNGYDYTAIVPAEILTPGSIAYRIIIRDDKYVVYPGAHEGDPYAWDNFLNDTYQSYVASPGASVELFDPGTDRNMITMFNPDWRNNSFEYITSSGPHQLLMKMTAKDLKPAQMFGWQFYFGDKIRGRAFELRQFDALTLRARNAGTGKQRVKLSVITKHGATFSRWIDLGSGLENIIIPIKSLAPDSLLLLPRAYPGFQPLWFQASGFPSLDFTLAEKIELLIIHDSSRTGSAGNPVNIEIESVLLSRSE